MNKHLRLPTQGNPRSRRHLDSVQRSDLTNAHFLFRFRAYPILSPVPFLQDRSKHAWHCYEYGKDKKPRAEQAPCQDGSKTALMIMVSNPDDSEPGYKTSSGGYCGHLFDGWLSHTAEEHGERWPLAKYKT